MKGRRRITSIILALALALGLIPSVSSIAFADDTTEKVKDVYIDNTVDESVSYVTGTVHITGSGGIQAGYSEEKVIYEQSTTSVTYSNPKTAEVQGHIDAAYTKVYNIANDIKSRAKRGEFNMSTSESTGKVWDNRKYTTVEDGDAILIGDSDYLTGAYGVNDNYTRTHIASGGYGKETFYKVAAIGWVEGYSITVISDNNGTASANFKESLSKETVALTAEANEGYVFKEWEVVTGGANIQDTNAASTSFVMPASDVEIRAIFEPEEEESNVVLTIHWSSVDGLDLMKPIIIKVRPKEDGTYPTLGEVLTDNEVDWDGLFKKDGYTQMFLGVPIPPITKPLTEYKAVIDALYDVILDSEVIDTSMDIYKILLKEVDRLELTIEPPVCGESMGEFIEDEGISANPPVVTTPDEYNEVLNVINTYWLILEEDYNADDSMFVGEKDYRFAIALGLKQGYVFVEDLDIVLDGGTIVDPMHFANVFFTGATMTPEHDPDIPIIEDIVSPTCDKDGSHTEIILCKACGEEISRETVVDEKLGHNWGAWTVTKEATETETGERRRICRNDPSHVEYETIPIVKKPVEFKLTYDLAGGEFNGSTDPIIETHEKDSEIAIHDAPTKEGSTFLYWEGSKYMPGDKYTVTEDHTFTAVWEDASTDNPGENPGTDEPGTDNPSENSTDRPGTKPGDGTNQAGENTGGESDKWSSNSAKPSDSGNLNDGSSNTSTGKDNSSASSLSGGSADNRSSQDKSASSASGVPKTGDEGFAVMWLVIALLSMIATFWLNRLYKKIGL